MINCAIYPRKSKANDNSQSMEQQIADCRKYIEDKYPDANIKVYDGDYALTGHSTKKRKDFLKMMDDIRNHKIQLVVIMRYDRIARNMRDFCNLYHDMEENGCNLVSVSQQIDTSTPYGKNFMYQMASMAELEWAIISERYKDMHKYKIAHGYAYTGKIPRFGFKIEQTADGKRVVHDREKETIDIFKYFLYCKSKNETVRYVRKKYDTNFTRRMFESMVKSDLYIGKAKDNENFCQPYFNEDYMNRIRSLNCIKATPTGNVYLFSGLVRCPLCGRKLSANPSKKDGTLYVYYRCPSSIQSKHRHFAVKEYVIENAIETDLEAYLCVFLTNLVNVSSNKRNDVKSQITKAEDAMSRLDHLFEIGRISIEEYDRKILERKNHIKELRNSINDKPIKAKNVLNGNWKEMYDSLDRERKRLFIQNIIEEIKVSDEAEVASIIFK